tara:strand:+ start:57 stop:458 length:402 start_codon:yes stop_codon:yes gene_type:complete
MSCIFCDIVNKKANVSIIFENKKVICFLPKEMEVYGHLLTVPKDHYENIFDISKEDLFEFISVVQDMSHHIKKSLGATGVNILNANGKDADQSVSHLHFHIIPRFKDDGVEAWPPLPSPEIDRDELFNKLRVK